MKRPGKKSLLLIGACSVAAAIGPISYVASGSPFYLIALLVQGAMDTSPILSATNVATLVDDVDGQGASAGDTLQYTVQLSNTGDADALGVVYEDRLDLNTTLVDGSVNVSPLAVDDAYMVNEGDVLVVDGAPNPTLLDNDREFLGDTFSLTAFSTTTTPQGIAVNVAADGTFTYTPPFGFGGIDSFTYTIEDPAGLTGTGTVNIDVNQRPDITVGGSDSAAETLTETNAGLSVSNTLSVEDLDTTDTVDASVVSVSVTGDDDGIGNAGLLAMMSVGANPVIGNATTTGTINWTFDSGSEAFDHLAVSESLVLAYTLRATDNESATDDQTVTITINGSNDDPVITVGGSDSAAEMLTETNAGLSVSGTLSVEDLDTTDTVDASVVSVSVTGDDDGIGNADLLAMMSVGANPVIGNATTTGTINRTFDSGSEAFDHLAVSESLVLAYLLRATDSQSATDDQTVTITINGSNDDPVITSDGGGATAGVNAAENQTAVTDVESTDPEGETEGAGLTYSLTGGADQAKFAIDGNTGVLTFNSAPDFENPGDADTNNDYEVQVTVTDSGGLTDVQDLTVTVTNANDAPTITSAANPSVPENQTAVIDVQSTDPEGETEGAGLTYSLTGGADQAKFAIDGNTGVLTFNSAPDFEIPGDDNTDNDYEVQVTVTDGGGLTDVQDITVTVDALELSAAAGTGAFTYTPGVRLSEAKLNGIVEAAIERWSAAGISAEERARLETGFVISIVDRPGLFLGSATANALAIDRDGGGYGWYVDDTPGRDEEFERSKDGTELRAVEGSDASRRMDLLTVVLHELGHMLGRSHEDGVGLMAETLPTGVRRLPGSPHGRDSDPPDRRRSETEGSSYENVSGAGCRRRGSGGRHR